MKQIERVLVIDDDPACIYLTKRLLQKLGIGDQVQTANNGVEALQVIKQAFEGGQLPQLVLLDIRMPMMDGFTFLNELKKLSLTGLTDSDIVMLTSSKSPVDAEKAKVYSLKGFLNKPVTEENLRSILGNY